MIKLTKMSKQSFFLNERFIETIESTPDTVIILENGKKFIVLESSDEVVRKISEEIHNKR